MADCSPPPPDPRQTLSASVPNSSAPHPQSVHWAKHPGTIEEVVSSTAPALANRQEQRCLPSRGCHGFFRARHTGQEDRRRQTRRRTIQMETRWIPCSIEASPVPLDIVRFGACPNNRQPCRSPFRPIKRRSTTARATRRLSILLPGVPLSRFPECHPFRDERPPGTGAKCRGEWKRRIIEGNCTTESSCKRG